MVAALLSGLSVDPLTRDWLARIARWSASNAAGHPPSAAIAFALRMHWTVVLGRPAGEADPRLAGERSGRPQLLQEDRSCEVVALCIADLGGALEVGQFLEGFDALGDDAHAERLAQGFDRAQDALAARALVDVRDEGAIDLDLVCGDVGKRRQRGVAGAEIVDRDADAG